VTEDRYPVSVHILDKEYRIACADSEEENLLKAAHYLDAQMREIRAGGKVIGADRIAVMAALNMAHDLLEQRLKKDDSSENISKRLQIMQDKIAVTLDQRNQLDL
jgi:cell division protein ZapA